MIFQHTHAWILGVSPHTGLPKRNTLRPARTMDRTHWGVQQGLGVISAVLRRHGTEYHRYLYPGQLRGVQARRGGPARGTIRIMNIDLIGPEIVTPATARAEGFASVADLLALYEQMHGPDSLREPCYSIRFELIGKGALP